MSVKDKLFLSIRSAFCSGLPSVLCILAIAVATFTAGTIYHLSKAATDYVSGQLSRIGVAGITLYSDHAIPDTREAVQCLAAVPGVETVMPFAAATGSIRGREVRKTALFMGVEADVSRIYQLDLLHGRSFTQAELLAGEPVILVDDQVAAELYMRTNIVGKQLRLNGDNGYLTATVIGVYSSQKQGLESSLGIDIPEIIYLPLGTLNDFAGTVSPDKIAIACLEDADPEQVGHAAALAMTRLTGQTIKYENISGYYGIITGVTETVGQAILVIGLVAVFVGGLGLMIAMLSAVDRRRNTIGIYMALGAPGSTIIGLFVLESVELCLIGGIAGSLLSMGAIRLLAQYLPLEVQRMIYPVVMTAAGVCGVIFGILPAVRAARLDPIQALTE